MALIAMSTSLVAPPMEAQAQVSPAPSSPAQVSPAPSSPESGDVVMELTLEQTLELLMSRSEDWQITELLIERSRAARREALAGLLPQLSLQATATRNDQEIEVQGRIVRPLLDWGASMTASIVLFDGTRYPQYARSGALLEVTRAEAAWRRHLLALEAEQAFFTVAAAQREIEIAEQAIALREAHLERAEALMEADMAVQLDVARARTELLEARQLLLEAQANVENAADSLLVLIGLEPDQNVRVRIAELRLEAPPEAVRTGEELLERSDFEAEQGLIRATELSRRAVWWSLIPRLDLQATARQSPATFSSPGGLNWSASLVFSWLLYDGGARYARMRAIDTEIAERELLLERNVREASAELVRALRDWQLAASASRVAEEQVASAREAHEFALARFEAGLSTSTDVIDAAQALLRAEVGLNQLELRTRLAMARYRYLETTDAGTSAN